MTQDNDLRPGLKIPRWLLPLLAGAVVVAFILGASGLVEISGKSECEEAGGTLLDGPGVRDCIIPEEGEGA